MRPRGDLRDDADLIVANKDLSYWLHDSPSCIEIDNATEYVKKGLQQGSNCSAGIRLIRPYVLDAKNL